MRFLGFSKKELVAVVAILSVLFAATFINLQTSLQRGRDVQRKNDIRAITDALLQYGVDRKFFPPSYNGKIVACNPKVESNQILFKACEWFTDPLGDIQNNHTPVYLERIPTDPHHNQGARYHYISTGEHFQLFAALEGSDEPEYDLEIVARNLPCGGRICNFGRGSDNTPLNIPLEQYEAKLVQLELEKAKSAQ